MGLCKVWFLQFRNVLFQKLSKLELFSARRDLENQKQVNKYQNWLFCNLETEVWFSVSLKDFVKTNFS